MMGLDQLKCEHCDQLEFEVEDIRPDSRWYKQWPTS